SSSPPPPPCTGSSANPANASSPPGPSGHPPLAGGGRALTVIAAVPLWRSLVAAIVADPTPTALTNPLPFTVAIVPSLLVQPTARPLSGSPFASLGVAMRYTVCPTDTLADDGVTVTKATGTLVPVTPGLSQATAT